MTAPTVSSRVRRSILFEEFRPLLIRAAVGLFGVVVPGAVYFVVAPYADALGTVVLRLCLSTAFALLALNGRAGFAIVILAAVEAIGIGALTRLGHDPGRVSILAAASIALVAVTALLTPLPMRLRLRLRTVLTASFGILALCVVLRALPAFFGGDALKAGTLPIAGIPGVTSVQIGEWTRPIVVVAMALFLHAVAQMIRTGHRVRLGYLLGVFSVGLSAYLFILLAWDQGPFVVTVTGLVVLLVAFSQRVRFVALRPPIGVLALAASLFVAAAVIAIRVIVTDEETIIRITDVFTPVSNQLVGALTAMRLGGALGAGFGTSPSITRVPAVSSDYLPSVVGADLGIISMIAVASLIVIAVGTVAFAARSNRTPAAAVGTALTTMLIVQTTILVSGNLSLIPVTGLSAPFLAVTGSSALPVGISLGIAIGSIYPPVRTRTEAARQPSWRSISAWLLDDRRFLFSLIRLRNRCSHSWPITKNRRGRRLPVLALICIPVMMLAGIKATVGPLELGSLFQLQAVRGDILAVDGTVIAGTALSSNGGVLVPERTYPGGALYSDLGAVAPAYNHYGLEAEAAGELTCGDRFGLDDLAAVFLRKQCGTVDVVTSISPSVQNALAAALGDERGAGIVLDSKTGQVSGLYSTGQTDPTELPYGVVPASPALTEATPPGSVFKIIDAAAALIDDIDTSVAPLDQVTFEGGYINNNGEATCSDPSITTMLTESCNTTAAFVGLTAGSERIAQVAQEYFGADSISSTWFDAADDVATIWTGIDGDMSDGATARTAIGQESVQATVLGVAVMTGVVAASAKGRALPQPHSWIGSCDSQGAIELKTEEVIGGVLPTDVAETILTGMSGAATSGTAARLGLMAPDGRKVAAKTGTAEIQVNGEIVSTDSWTTAIIDGRWIVSAVVHDVPIDAGNRAVGVVADMLNFIPTSTGKWTCPIE